jgi:hypothetical protein
MTTTSQASATEDLPIRNFTSVATATSRASATEDLPIRNFTSVATTTSRASATEDLPIYNFTNVANTTSRDSAIEGLKDLPIDNFTTIARLKGLVKKQSNWLITGESTQQYIVIGEVTKAALERIDKAYSTIGKHIRLTYFLDPQLLIIKLMPCKDHEQAHLELFGKILIKIARMGLDDNVALMGGSDYWNTQQNFRKQGEAFDLTLREQVRTIGLLWSLRLGFRSPCLGSESMPEGG